ncbi:MAG: hypothetical protein JWL59_3568 [Chthoniobacteraceae bacterium]|nr:hypothetical protein [Chthoniobacteraceae bacterium]
MSILLQTVAGLGRAGAVSGVSLWLAMGAIRLIASRRGRIQNLLWTLLIAPCLMPSFLTGYAWARAILAITMRPGWNELIYAAALVVRLMPVAVLALYFLPPPLGVEGMHCYRLLKRNSALASQRFFFAGLGAGPWIAFALVFLLSFGEFELAAMWSLKTWPVVLFDAQAGGLALKETLRLVAVPATVQAVLLGALVARGNPQARSRAVPGTGFKPAGRVARCGFWFYLVAAAATGALCPLALVIREALSGFQALRGNALLIRDIGTSLFFATGAAGLSWSIAGFSKKTGGERGSSPKVGWLLGAPGMLGGLVLALLLLAGFQTRPLRALYDTPVPLFVALTFLLLPLALCLRWLCNATRPAPALHIARMLKNNRLVWHLDGRRRWWSLFLLFCWGYFEFTASTLLAPIGMTPVIARLHNLSHYGQTAVLSAMICAAVSVPLLVLLLTATGRGLYARIRGQSSYLETGSRLPGTRQAA